MKLVNLGTWVFLFCFCNDFNDPQIHSESRQLGAEKVHESSPLLACLPFSAVTVFAGYQPAKRLCQSR